MLTFAGGLVTWLDTRYGFYISYFFLTYTHVQEGNTSKLIFIQFFNGIENTTCILNLNEIYTSDWNKFSVIFFFCKNYECKHLDQDHSYFYATN